MKIHRGEKYYTVWAKEVDKNILMDFWTQLSASKMAKITFYEYLPKNAEEFVDWANSDSLDLRLVGNQNNQLIAMYWLNNLLGKMAMIHFCIQKNAVGEQIELGNYVTQSLLSAKDEKNEFIISGLMGHTPKSYRHALNFIQKIGFQITLTLPKSCYFQEKNKYVDGVISVLKNN